MNDENKKLQEETQAALFKAAKDLAAKVLDPTSGLTMDGRAKIIGAASQTYLAALGIPSHAHVDPPPDMGRQAK